MIIKAQMVQDKVTKGAVRFAEVNDKGEVVTGDESSVTQLYIRKTALNGQTPQKLTVTIETE